VVFFSFDKSLFVVSVCSALIEVKKGSGSKKRKIMISIYIFFVVVVVIFRSITIIVYGWSHKKAMI
jgi:uncharacterized membrane protein